MKHIQQEQHCCSPLETREGALQGPPWQQKTSSGMLGVATAPLAGLLLVDQGQGAVAAHPEASQD